LCTQYKNLVEKKACTLQAMITKQIENLQIVEWDKYKNGQTIKQILDEAMNQARNYAVILKKKAEFQNFNIFIHVVLSVGTHKILYNTQKFNPNDN
jgi:hypothetical protein